MGDDVPSSRTGHVGSDPSPELDQVSAQCSGVGLLPQLTSRETAGGTLADLALGVIRSPAGRYYAALRSGAVTWPSPSELGSSDPLMHALWEDSAELVGLPASWGPDARTGA